MKAREESFVKIARYFIKKQEKKAKIVSLKRMPGDNSTTKILRIKSEGKNKKETFVIKILEEAFPTDKNVSHLQNEITIQGILKVLGFTVKDCLLVKLNSNNPTGIPFAVSTFIEGKNLNVAAKREIPFLVPKVLDYLYSLHSKTLSPSFGYIEKNNFLEPTLSFGELESIYLRADIQRDNINFTYQEKKALCRAIKCLDKAKSFCLCHCDVTLRNTLWDGSEPHLIDWTYSRFAEPAHDIAHVIFWLADLGLKNQIQKELAYAFKRYQKLRLNIISRFPYYLGQRYIEFGRIKGKDYIEKGKYLLKCVPTKTLKGLLRCINKAIQKEIVKEGDSD